MNSHKANKAKADKWQAFISGIEEIQSLRIDRIKTLAAYRELVDYIESVTNDKLERRRSQDK